MSRTTRKREPIADDPDFPADAFAGTAPYYAKYRVPYPKELFYDLRRRANISAAGWMLDLACGTGEIALPMAPFFREVWAVDQEPEMIAVGRSKAIAADVGDISWRTGRAEDLDLPPASFELVTIGNAFHRVDRALVANRAWQWLIPRRCFALLFSTTVWSGKEEWQLRAVEVIGRWTKPSRRADEINSRAPSHEQILSSAGFEKIEEHRFEVPYVWTIESFVGFLYSTSAASKALLGDAVADFEADLRLVLLDYDSAGRYSETIQFAYILARRPAE